MNRLIAYDKKLCEYFLTDESRTGHQSMKKRLFDYEGTNLTPSDIADLRNELCLKCGRYKTAHEGSCDSCKWAQAIASKPSADRAD